MDTLAKGRLNRTIKSALEVLVIGALYFLFVTLTGLYLPCPFRAVTGLLCPGCGISHMFVHLSHLEFGEAFHDNAYVLMLLPVAIPYGIYRAYRYIKSGATDYSKIETVFIAVALMGAIAFGVIRNIS